MRFPNVSQCKFWQVNSNACVYNKCWHVDSNILSAHQAKCSNAIKIRFLSLGIGVVRLAALRAAGTSFGNLCDIIPIGCRWWHLADILPFGWMLSQEIRFFSFVGIGAVRLAALRAAGTGFVNLHLPKSLAFGWYFGSSVRCGHLDAILMQLLIELGICMKVCHFIRVWHLVEILAVPWAVVI